MPPRAVLFDLGNTLVSYYRTAEFPVILQRCLAACLAELGSSSPLAPDDDLLRRALDLNRETSNLAVWPLGERHAQLFPACARDPDLTQRLTTAFLQPIFATAILDPDAHYVLATLRSRGIRTAIVSNTPWGSSAVAWRAELARHGLLDAADATVFCMDVGYRKPHPAPILKALELLATAAGDAVFVGDHPRWDVVGAQRAGVQALLLAPEDEDHLPTDVPVIRRLRDVLEHAEVAGMSAV